MSYLLNNNQILRMEKEAFGFLYSSVQYDENIKSAETINNFTWATSIVLKVINLIQLIKFLVTLDAFFKKQQINLVLNNCYISSNNCVHCKRTERSLPNYSFEFTVSWHEFRESLEISKIVINVWASIAH